MTGAPPPPASGGRPDSGRSSGPSKGLTHAPGSHADDGALLVAEVVLGTMLLFTLFVAPILGALTGAGDSEDAAVGELVQNSVFSVFILTLGFQVIQGCYPWIRSRRRGRTIAEDWHFVSKLPDDIAAGMVLAIGCFGGAYLAQVVVASLVGLDDTADASNTDILADNRGSVWIVGVILLVVVGAPLVEELLFRGFILRTLQRRFGGVAAIVLSSFLFAIPHWQPDATWQETAVLLTALGIVGLVLAIGAVVTDRLGPSVIAHFLFNATGTLITLFA